MHYNWTKRFLCFALCAAMVFSDSSFTALASAAEIQKNEVIPDVENQDEAIVEAEVAADTGAIAADEEVSTIINEAAPALRETGEAPGEESEEKEVAVLSVTGVDDVTYKDLSEALKAFDKVEQSKSTTLKILEDCTIEGSYNGGTLETLNNDIYHKIDLNGKTVTIDGSFTSKHNQLSSMVVNCMLLGILCLISLQRFL